MKLEARCVPKVSIALITGDPRIVRDAWRNGRECIARRVAAVLRASLTTLVACGAHVHLSHGRRQVRDDAMLTVIQQVDPLGCGSLPVKHDVDPEIGIHHNHILRKMALKGP